MPANSPCPSYYQTWPAVATSLPVQQQKHVFHITARQGSTNQRKIVPMAEMFGSAWAIDWVLMDGATVIGRMEGVVVRTTQNWFLPSTLVFIDQRFQGSTLNVQGRLGPAVLPDEGNWAVLGGTGEFTCAQDNVAYKRIQVSEAGGCTMELCVRVVCLTFPKPKPVQKVGPWGGNEGTAYEIDAEQPPQRLESLTIYDNGHVIESIEFSYTDQAGQNRSVGPWGDADDGKSENPPIQFGASESVKEIYGATGKFEGRTVVTTLTIVTNVTAYGPYGRQSRGNTPFHVAAPNDHQSIVGFYGRADEGAVNQIGAYIMSSPRIC